jgi:hypothetical protein
MREGRTEPKVDHRRQLKVGTQQLAVAIIIPFAEEGERLVRVLGELQAEWLHGFKVLEDEGEGARFILCTARSRLRAKGMQVLNLHPSARFGIEGQEELIDAQRVDSDTPRAREGGPKLAAVERTAMLMRLGEEDLDQQTFGVGAPREGSSRGSRSKSGEIQSPALLTNRGEMQPPALLSESVFEERRARHLIVEPIVKLDLYRQQV